MLEDLEQGVDKADTKLNSAMKKMRKFIRDTEGELLFSIRGEHCLTSCDLQKQNPVGVSVYSL